MKSFQTCKEDGTPFGYLLVPDEGPIVEQEKLSKILCFIKYVGILAGVSNILLNNMSVEGNKIVFSSENDNSEELIKILNMCDKKLTEFVIVPQVVNPQLNPIRHRPLYFGLTEDNKSIEVRYTTFGEFNSIDIAISELHCQYPGATEFNVN